MACRVLRAFCHHSLRENDGKVRILFLPHRDEVERLFRADGTFAPCESVATKKRLKGRTAVEFVALILYYHKRMHRCRAYTYGLSHPNHFL